MDIAGLKDMAQTWKHLAEDNRNNPAMRAHCAIRIHEYERNMADREQQYEEWLEQMSTAKQGLSKHSAKQRHTTPDSTRKSVSPYSSRAPKHTPSYRRARVTSTDVSPTPSFHDSARTEARKHVEAEYDTGMARQAQDRIVEKAQHEARKQAKIEKRAAAVHAEKEKQRAKVELQAQQNAERIPKTRAKVGVAPLGTVGPTVRNGPGTDVARIGSPVDHIISGGVQTNVKKTCTNCGVTRKFPRVA